MTSRSSDYKDKYMYEDTQKYTTVFDLFRVVFLQFTDIISMSLAEKESLESQKKYFFFLRFINSFFSNQNPLNNTFFLNHKFHFPSC